MSEKMSDKLDYRIKNIDDRKKLVEKIIKENDGFLVDYYDNHYNPHINQTGLLSENTRISKDLESLANYLLYSKDSNASEDTVTGYRKKRNNRREASIDKLLFVEPNSKKKKVSYKKPSNKVTESDRKKFKDLRETGLIIKRLSKSINTGLDSKGNPIDEIEIRKLKWIRTDIQKDEVAIKNELARCINFGNITKSEPDYKALSYIQFDNPEIIRILIEGYSELKESSYEDTFGYMKIILFTLEDLIDKSNLDDYMIDILKWKIDNLSHNEMIELLKEKYNIKMTKPRLSKTTRETLPNLIANTYKQQREDWMYTFAMKGNYKTCNSCKNNYLATVKYFSPDKSFKTGLKSVCKKCRKNKYKKKPTAKKV